MATSKHILVVDDDSYVRESTEEILRRRGYEVDTAADGKAALFPDSVTVRGQKHLRELSHAARRGHRAVMLFWVYRQDCQSFSPADQIDPEYGRLLRKAVRGGVEVLVYSARVSPRQVLSGGPLTLRL